MQERTDVPQMYFPAALERLKSHLASLASTKLQTRYCINGTADEYILVDGLLEGIVSDLLFFRWERNPERWPMLQEQIGDKALSHILSIETLYKSSPKFLEEYTFDTLTELIHHDPTWSAIRTQANSALEEMAFDLDQWERQNVSDE